jgi:hypothetical protein
MEEAEEGDSSSQASFVNNLKKALDKIIRNNCDIFEIGPRNWKREQFFTAEISCPEKTSGANIKE